MEKSKFTPKDSFSDQELEKLILEVKRHPCLYDTAVQTYRDSKQKENAWKKIARTLCSSVETVKKVWKNLRDKFRRTKTLQQKNSGAEPSQTEWALLAPMSFLVPFVKCRSAHTDSGANNDGPESIEWDFVKDGSGQPHPEPLLDKVGVLSYILEPCNARNNSKADVETGGLDVRREDGDERPTELHEREPASMPIHGPGPSDRRKAVKRKSADLSDNVLDRVLVEMKNCNKAAAVDEYDLVFAGFAAQCRQLPRQKWLKVQMKVLQAINEAFSEDC